MGINALTGVIAAAALVAYPLTHHHARSEVSLAPATASNNWLPDLPRGNDSTPDQARVQRLEAFLDTPLSENEQLAKPYFDRITNNAQVMDAIHVGARVYNLDPVSVMMTVAAETSGLESQFGVNKTSSARTFMQITRDQFIALAGKYGFTYRSDMAAVYGNRFEAEGREMDFLRQFIKTSDGGLHYTLRADLYEKYYHDRHERAPPLEHRIEALWTNAYVGPILQMRSNAHDEANLKSHLVSATGLGLPMIERKIGPHVFQRGINFMGAGRFFNACKIILSGHGNETVVGHIMDLATAERNFAPRPAGLFSFLKHKITARNETVQEKFDFQIAKWDKVYEGMVRLRERQDAEAFIAQAYTQRPARVAFNPPPKPAPVS